MITESEARDKTCPILTADPSTDSVSKCLGSKCMAWRWKISENGNQLAKGYCGLAGKP